ncbi:hypothetical protein [uncultured Brachyspira sp.]|uniref:hypothetical protein n=1 Tax=uncultured Brachyspira sp. TaxID=221953 RepID=UPI00260E1AEA|nr:hypothetical protein [uncultured Brachyspira sp.]
MVKKILISSIMIISLISCGNKSQQNDSAKNNTENKVIENGSWNIDTQQSDAINEDIKTIFSNATKELLGVKRELMLYLGNQIDEGINYAFICRSEILAPSALPYYEIIICNVSDQNETSITKIEKIIESSQSSVGGIICTSSDEAKINTSKSKESEDIIKIFENAIKNAGDVKYNHELYVANQVVKGINYYFIASDETSIKLLTINNFMDSSEIIKTENIL